MPLPTLPRSLALLCCLPLAAWAADGTLHLHAEPGTVYAEHVAGTRAINFELRLDNAGDALLAVARIEVTARDAQDRVLLRRFVDGNGVRPSLEVLGPQGIPARGGLTVFNPFPRFADELPLRRLHYMVDTVTADGSPGPSAELDVMPRDYRNASAMTLPLRGRLINYDGHDWLGHHRRFDPHAAPIAALGFRANFMRYSYDFVPVDAQGDMLHGDRDDNRAWLGFGQPILAVADGVVVASRGDRPDNRRFDPARLAGDHWELFGNFVVIDQGHGEFAVYAHAQQDSVSVHPGQRVRRGQPIARIGASGSAFFPHLHFQLQDGPDTAAEGLPSYFGHFDRVVGDRLIPRQDATVDTGEIVQAR